MTNAVTKSTGAPVSNLPDRAPSLMARFAAKYAVDPDKMLNTLKSTCFKGNVSNEQMMALLIVADQYQLNPFTKEIYAFPDKNNGIVPVVGVDGWIRIVNSNPDFESMTFVDGPLNENNIPEWIECTIHLRNRRAPMVIKEWFAECAREVGPWKSHPRRMLRHKAMIQCARLALGFVGIYDPDEAERISNAIDVTPAKGKPVTQAPKAKSKEIAQHPIAVPALISLDQSTLLADTLNAEGVELNALLAAFELGSLEELPADKFEAAKQWIEEASAG